MQDALDHLFFDTFILKMSFLFDKVFIKLEMHSKYKKMNLYKLSRYLQVLLVSLYRTEQLSYSSAVLYKPCLGVCYLLGRRYMTVLCFIVGNKCIIYIHS